MANLSMHLIIPLLLLLLLSERRRLIFFTLPFAILPDLDHFYLHRALLHNIFIPIFLLTLYFFLPGKRKYILLFISFYLISHIFLDYFDDGIVLFFPLSSSLYYTTVDLGVELTTEKVITITETGERIVKNVTITKPVTEIMPKTFEYSMVKFREYLQFSSSVEFAIFTFCLVVVAIKLRRG
jgi:membrane-bound metal-dependent hydrolase YbcI (DUF457 family)